MSMNSPDKFSLPLNDGDEPLGDIIRADPSPTLKYTVVALAGLMGGVVIGYVYSQHAPSSAATSFVRAPASPP